MIHILLTILKIIGILLLVLLGLILMIVVLVLFVPLRYRFHAGINEGTALNILLERAPLITDDEKLDLLENLELTGNVTWLLKLVRVVVKFFSKTFDYKVQVAFFDVLSSEPREKRKHRTKKRKPVKAAEGRAVQLKEPADKEQITPNAMNQSSSHERPPETIVENAATDEPVPDQEKKEQQNHNVKKQKKPKKDIPGTIEELSEKARNVLDMVGNTDNQEFVIMAFTSLKKLLWHIRPRKYFVYLYYGADDPSLTGKVMMAYGIAKGVFGMEHLKVMPDFEHKVVRLSAELEGRIRLIHVAVIGCKIYFNKTFRKLIGGR